MTRSKIGRNARRPDGERDARPCLRNDGSTGGRGNGSLQGSHGSLLLDFLQEQVSRASGKVFPRGPQFQHPRRIVDRRPSRRIGRLVHRIHRGGPACFGFRGPAGCRGLIPEAEVRHRSSLLPEPRAVDQRDAAFDRIECFLFQYPSNGAAIRYERLSGLKTYPPLIRTDIEEVKAKK